jgi:hypothetical protein
MRSKLNIVLGVVAAGVITSAYAACYLQGDICLYANGQLVEAGACVESYSFVVQTSPYQTSSACSLTANVYADQNAYQYNIYSVTAGGMNSSGAQSYGPGWGDGGTFGWYNQYYPGVAGNGFQIYYVNSPLGITATAINGPPGNGNLQIVNRTFYYLLDQTPTACN